MINTEWLIILLILESLTIFVDLQLGYIRNTDGYSKLSLFSFKTSFLYKLSLYHLVISMVLFDSIKS